MKIKVTHPDGRVVEVEGDESELRAVWPLIVVSPTPVAPLPEPLPAHFYPWDTTCPPGPLRVGDPLPTPCFDPWWNTGPIC